MIRPLGSIIRSLALVCALAGSAAAQTVAPAPSLRANVIVDSDVVRIGDLVANAGPVADIPIFRAPDLGTRGVVATARVVDAIRPHQLIDIDTRGLAEVVVTRASRAITVPEISASIAQALSGQYGLGAADHVGITFDRQMRNVQVEPGATGALQVVALSYEARTGRFDATLDLPSSAVLHQQPVHISGTAVETVDTVAVDHVIQRGEVLKASELVTVRRPKVLAANTITDIAGAVGLAARHELRPGQPINAADLMRPEVVQRNDTVTIVYQVPGLTLTLRGQAQDSGALGDSIGVLNMESKRVVQCVVAGPGRVTVTAPVTRFVENGTATPDDATAEPPATAE